MELLEKPDTLAGSLVQRIRDLIDDGSLQDGERVNEVWLSGQLGVSRTPLREALNRLVSEQIVTLRPRHGYFVPDMTTVRFEAEYGIRPILDVAALQLGGLPAPRVVQDLGRLNSLVLGAQTIRARIAADDAFHLKLVAHAPNAVLIDLIRQMMQRTRRYEFAYFRECDPVLSVVDAHARIIAALQKRDLAGACKALHDNLTSGLEPIRAWLDARSSKRPAGGDT